MLTTACNSGEKQLLYKRIEKVNLVFLLVSVKELLQLHVHDLQKSSKSVIKNLN